MTRIRQNTVGMGAYAPAPWLMLLCCSRWKTIIQPTLGPCKRGVHLYRYALCRLISREDAQVLEYNALWRPGNGSSFTLLKSDSVPLLLATTNNTMNQKKLNCFRLCSRVVLASGGYPDIMKKGR